MSKVKNSKFWAAVITFLIVFFALCMLMLTPGCKVLRNIEKKSSDSTSVSKTTTVAVDTTKGGAVKKTNIKEENEWWKKTEIFGQRDTNTTVNNIYPSTIIYEGGKGSKEVNTFDSNWFKNALSLMQASIDSTNKKNEEYLKNSKTESKGLGVWLIVICFAVYWLLTTGIGWLTSKYTFFIPKNKMS